MLVSIVEILIAGMSKPLVPEQFCCFGLDRLYRDAFIEDGGEKLVDVELTRCLVVNVNKLCGIGKIRYNIVDIITIIRDGTRQCFGKGLFKLRIIFHCKGKGYGKVSAQ